ncbi:uncharacterized protein RAG0_07670 [Rhynchosporium agropyri]|uniref:Uncharacterized protein n=1 Tax=Rhynchosporium agropyri TaxID=914238 RepID=A0A1E1KMT2_9HELO|nr:uncharacterized protein RAG0_07670 [Rhynchosporium agropyri]
MLWRKAASLAPLLRLLTSRSSPQPSRPPMTLLHLLTQQSLPCQYHCGSGPTNASAAASANAKQAYALMVVRWASMYYVAEFAGLTALLAMFL